MHLPAGTSAALNRTCRHRRCVAAAGASCAGPSPPDTQRRSRGPLAAAAGRQPAAPTTRRPLAAAVPPALTEGAALGRITAVDARQFSAAALCLPCGTCLPLAVDRLHRTKRGRRLRGTAAERPRLRVSSLAAQSEPLLLLPSVCCTASLRRACWCAGTPGRSAAAVPAMPRAARPPPWPRLHPAMGGGGHRHRRYASCLFHIHASHAERLAPIAFQLGASVACLATRCAPCSMPPIACLRRRVEVQPW